MLKVVVTGRMGAGKSSVLRVFHGKNHPVCRADDLARSFLTRESPCYAALKALFGPEGLTKTGEWNRKNLARQIFQDDEKRRKLERIIHPLVQREFEKRTKEWKKKGAGIVFYEAPLTADISHSRFDRILFVEVREDLAIQRLLKKGFDREDIKRRLRIQDPRHSLIKTADFILRNEGSPGDLKEKAEQVLQHIQQQNRLDFLGKRRVF